MATFGFSFYRYRLVAFIIAGAICGIAGVLSANQTDFVSPSVMHWTRSGDLIIRHGLIKVVEEYQDSIQSQLADDLE